MKLIEVPDGTYVKSNRAEGYVKYKSMYENERFEGCSIKIGNIVHDWCEEVTICEPKIKQIELW